MSEIKALWDGSGINIYFESPSCVPTGSSTGTVSETDSSSESVGFWTRSVGYIKRALGL